MKKVIALIVSAAMLMVCFVGCGSKKSKNKDSKFLGKWQSEKMVIEDQEYTDFMGIPINALIHLEIKSDGKFVLESPIDPTDDQSGKWSEDGDKLTIKIDDSKDSDDAEQVFELKDGKLVLFDESDDMGSVYLNKVDEFTSFDAEKFKQDMQQSFGNITLGDAD